MAIGDIIRIIGSLDFDLDGGTLPKIIHVAGTTYAIAYQGYLNDGFLRTVRISDDGATLEVISFLEFDTDNGRHPWIIHIAGTVYAIAYAGPGSNGTLKTFNISDDGTSISLIQTFVYDSGASIVEPVIVHISGTTYAIFYGGPGNDGWVKTVTIQDNGTITGEIAFLEYETVYGMYPSPVYVAGDVWAVAYTGDAINGSGRIRTFTITGVGAISAIASYDYDTNQTGPPDLFRISGNVFGIAYGGPGFDGWLKTTIINDDGTLGGAIISSLEFDPTYSKNVWVTFIASNVWCLTYDGPDSDGWLRTIEIETNGTITGEVGSLEYDSATGLYASMIHTTGDVYAIAYFGPGNDGWLKTVEITTTITPSVSTNPASAVGQTTATLNGTLDDDGGEACDCSFEYGETTGYGSTAATQSKTTGETFSQEVRGLLSGRVYHFRAIATNEAGTSYGADRTFHTEALSAEAHQALGRGYALGRHGL